MLQILSILAILLQAAERVRGPVPRTTAATPNSTPGPRGPADEFLGPAAIVTEQPPNYSG